MKNSKEIFDSAGQSTIEVKKSQKHDANLQKNSTLYFQIGLILCLLGTYALFEMQFQEKKLTLSEDTATVEEVKMDYVKPYIVEVTKPKKIEPLPSKDLKDVFKVVENDDPIIEKIVNTPDAPEVLPEPVKVGEIEPVEIPVDLPPVDFIRVEKVPVYPGCEKFDTNDERKKCMSKKISKLVNKKFNTDIASDHGITGMQRIYTQFTVDKKGNVTDVKIRGNHPALEKEAKRVIDKIPQMEPGLQRNTPVGVIYTLPIKFQVRN